MAGSIARTSRNGDRLERAAGIRLAVAAATAVVAPVLPPPAAMTWPARLAASLLLGGLLSRAVFKRMRSLAAARGAMAARLRDEEQILDAQAWMAVMKESTANMAEALNHAGRLDHFSRSVNILDAEDLKGVARRFMPKLFRADRFSVFLYRAHRRQLVLFTHNHPEWQDVPEPFVLAVDAGAGIMADAVATRAPVVVERFSRSRYAVPETAGRCADGPAVCVPLLAGGHVLGVLNVNGIGPELVNGGYVSMVRQTADHFALALYNAQLVARINEQAVRDPLTGLYNRRHFYHELARHAESARRTGGTFSVLLLDVDGFKTFNDTFGHAVGDQVLQAVAEEMKASLRKGDVPCRIGGDEFTALLAGATGEEAGRLAARLCRGIAARSHAAADGARLRLGVSAGIAECLRGEGHDELVRRADEALYAAKRARRGAWVLAAPGSPVSR